MGLLKDVKPGSPQADDDSDGDTGFFIRPDEPYYYLLKNRDDNWNDDVEIECEINVWPGARTAHGEWVASMASSQVTAVGVWVEDTGHDYKTELHPVDIIFGRVHETMIPGNWLIDIASAQGLRLDDNMYLFRFAMAADVRAYFPFNDQSDGRPPLAGITRPVTFTPKLPPRPPSRHGITLAYSPMWDMKSHLTFGSILGTGSGLRTVCGEQVLDITIEPQSLSEEEFEARSANSAAVLLGEFVTFWGIEQRARE